MERIVRPLDNVEKRHVRLALHSNASLRRRSIRRGIAANLVIGGLMTLAIL